jgi:glycosyltransferase involved in cell wall biosynthesis
MLHERRNRDRNSFYLRQVEEAAPQRVILSLEPVNYDDLDTLVSSGKIGVVLYREDFGLNFRLAGASGKLAQYLRCGLPVVCLDLPGVGDVVRKFDCGICVQSIDEMGEAIRLILHDYDRYSINALKCYMDNYEFGAHFEKVLRVISSLSVQSLQEQPS